MQVDPSNIELSPGQRQYVAAFAAQSGVPWEDVLARLVPTATQSPDEGLSAYELAARLGIINMSNDGPSDFATNPVYLEGLGQDGLDPCVD